MEDNNPVIRVEVSGVKSTDPRPASPDSPSTPSGESSAPETEARQRQSIRDWLWGVNPTTPQGDQSPTEDIKEAAEDIRIAAADFASLGDFIRASRERHDSDLEERYRHLRTEKADRKEQERIIFGPEVSDPDYYRRMGRPESMDPKYYDAPRWDTVRGAFEDPAETFTLLPDIFGERPEPRQGSVGELAEYARRHLSQRVLGTDAVARLAYRGSRIARHTRQMLYEQKRHNPKNVRENARIVFGELTGAAIEAGEALLKLRDAGLRSAEHLQNYSPQIATETATQEVENILMDIRHAQQYGDQLASLVKNQGEMQRSFTSLGRSVYDAFSPAVDSMLDVLGIIARILEGAMVLVGPFIWTAGKAFQLITSFIESWFKFDTEASGPVFEYEKWLVGKGDMPADDVNVTTSVEMKYSGMGGKALKHMIENIDKFK